MSWRRFQDIITRCLLEDVLKNKSCNYSFKTSHQDVLEDKKMLRWRRLQDVFSTSSPRRTFIITLCPLLPYVLEGVLKHLEDVLRKRFENVFKTSLEEVLQTCLEEVLGDEKLLHRRGLQDVFKTSSRRIGKQEIFASFKVFAPNYPSRLLKLLRSKINSSLERKYYIHEKLLTKCSWILNKTFWKKTTWHRINLFKMVEKKYSLLDLSCFCINLSFAVTQMHLHFYGVMVTHFNCLSWLLLLDYYQ